MPMSLTAEVAQHYLEIIKLLDKQWLLQGPLTSHPWLRLSATPYYFFFPIFALFRFHPLTLNYLWLITSILLIFLNYFTVKKVFDKKTAIISTPLLVFSPFLLNLLKLPGFFNFIIPLSYWLILILWKVVNKSNKKVWIVFFIISFMTTLHAAALMLLPIFIILFLIGKRFNKKQVLLSFVSFIIPQIPFFINDCYFGFSMTRKFLLWIPYKLVNFLSGKTFGLNKMLVPDQTLSIIFEFLNPLIFATLIYYFWKRKTSLLEKILFSWLIFGLTILFIHKNPPLHYFVPIAVIPIILLSRFLVSLNKDLASLFLALFVLIGLFNIFKTPIVNSDFISYKAQKKIATIIIKDAHGRKFSLTRQGPFDNYVGQFKQNYEYILWWMGNRPVNNSPINYFIEEDKNSVIIYRNGVTVSKISKRVF